MVIVGHPRSGKRGMRQTVKKLESAALTLWVATAGFGVCDMNFYLVKLSFRHSFLCFLYALFYHINNFKKVPHTKL